MTARERKRSAGGFSCVRMGSCFSYLSNGGRVVRAACKIAGHDAGSTAPSNQRQIIEGMKSRAKRLSRRGHPSISIGTALLEAHCGYLKLHILREK